jgi:hypothetical protein
VVEADVLNVTYTQKRKKDPTTEIYPLHDQSQLKEHLVDVEDKDTVQLAIWYPELFWNLVYHFKDPEQGLQELGLAIKRRRRR